MPAKDHTRGPSGAGRLANSISVLIALVAILGWIFAEWLIVAPCADLTNCSTRSWGGYYLPLQAVIAAAGLSSAVWLILRVLEGNSTRAALTALVMCAALWAVVVWVHTQVG